MKWRIPGTVLQIERENADGVEEIFSSMFLAGGMVLSQVSNITGLEPYTVQNWVKRGFLSPPQHKRYSMNQLCRILHINMLKSVLPLEQICGLLSYINVINKEINRKRAEFKLETLEIGQTLASKRIDQALVALEILAEDDVAYADLSITVSAAYSDEEIILLQDYSKQLMDELSSLDESTYFVKVSRQDQEKKSDGGYDIEDLTHEQLVYFAAQCIADAANALASY